jgi:hypothetical protein
VPAIADIAPAAHAVSAAPFATPALFATPAAAAPASAGASTSTLAADPVFVGAGDIASCLSTGDAATARLLAGIAGTVFTTGDNAYERGTASEFRNCYGPTWGRVLSRTHPVSGNHDYETSGATGYFGYFGSRAGAQGKGYYAYNLGAWRIYTLNSNCGYVSCSSISAQARWLKADLAAHPHRCTMALWHHPLFSSGSHGNQTYMRSLWNVLYAYHADVVLNGHDHDYERFARQSPTGALSTRGIREFVIGTGGRSHYPWGTIRAHSQVRNNTTFGVLKMTLHSTSYSWRFVPVAGQTWTDSGTTTCS